MQSPNTRTEGAPRDSTSATSSATRERTANRTATTAGEKINLNTASREQLESLPGIGPVKAQAIIEARPFNTIEDVMKVKGIKEGVFNEIKDQVTVK